MKKQRVLILHFPSLNNYGTAMMGLVTIQALADRFGADNVELYCDFNDYADIEEIKSELNCDIILKRHIDEHSDKIERIRNPFYRILRRLFYFPGKGFDYAIVLGGDDLSENYSSYGAAWEIFDKWKMSFRTRVVLLGQTLGPFSHPLNRFASKYLLSRLHVYAREPWCVEYLRKEFNVKINVMADLALMDLPLQNGRTFEADILRQYGLTTDCYFTMVISGLVKQYCNSELLYLHGHKNILISLAGRKELVNKKIVLLAHTFPSYQDEAGLISKLAEMLPEEIGKRMVMITDRILPTRARFILGNGLFTITGRMHAAVSTFQMGKPAICLSYSAKFKGVIGDSIGRYDLVIESTDPKMWNEELIVFSVMEKVDYLLSNYQTLRSQIKERIISQKQLVKEGLKSFTENEYSD